MSWKSVAGASLTALLAGCIGGGGGGSSSSGPPPAENAAPQPDPAPAPQPDPEPENPPSSGPDTQGSLGCSQPSPGSGTRTLVVGGIERSYIIDLPPGYDPEQPYPMVFGFHGRCGTAENFRSRSYGDLDSAMGDDAVLVYPQGIPDPNAEVQPERSNWERSGPRDLAFFDAMLEAITGDTCIDEARVFVTGMSMGGYFSARLACERGDVLRAFAAAAAGPPLVPASACAGRAAAWTAHDPQDELISYEDEGLPLRDYWLAANVCGNETRTLASGNCVEYTNCDVGFPVRWCEYDQTLNPWSNHHEWPEFAAREAWEFFRGLD